MDENQQRHTRARLEAFSDIIFGFSLAQLALTLPPPTRFASIRGVDLLAFTATFAFVCFMWWRHHLAFRDYFSPDRTSIVLNFILLGAVALAAYALESYAHGHLNTASVMLYAIVLGTMFLTMGLMVWRGVKLREGISAEVARRGRGWGLSFVLMGSVLLLSLLLLPLGTSWVATSWLLAPIVRVIGVKIGRGRAVAGA